MVSVFYMSRLFTVEASEPENKLKIIRFEQNHFGYFVSDSKEVIILRKAKSYLDSRYRFFYKINSEKCNIFLISFP